jgi:hypothetical protein
VKDRLRGPGPVAAVLLLGASAWLARAPMRITLVNTTLRIDDPWTRGAAIALGAIALLALAASLPGRRALQALLAVSALLTVVAAAAAATTWTEARPDELTARRWFAVTTLPWREVTRVDSWRDAVVVWSGAGGRIAVDARRLDAQQRAVLERTIARHVTPEPMVIGP